MNTISTTNPAPPSGITPTEVPLGTSGTISETKAPVNIPILKEMAMFSQQGRGLYLGSFEISTTSTVGTKVFDWSLKNPTYFNTLTLYNGYSNLAKHVRMPWEFILPYFSRMGKMDFDIEFIPVKVGDCRASLDIIFNQQNRSPAYSTAMLNSDSLHKVMDDMDDPCRFSVPAFWLTNNVSTRRSSPLNSTDLLQSPFIPYTRVSAYIRNKYQPNLMQPSSFSVVVILHPKPSNNVAIASMSAFVSQSGINVESNPWFLPEV